MGMMLHRHFVEAVKPKEKPVVEEKKEESVKPAPTEKPKRQPKNKR